jgi:uncharacterized damage-inducible protein DinB
MTIGESLLPEYDHEMNTTRKALERLPDDKFGWQPHEKSMMLGRLASHIAEFPHWAIITLQTETLELDPQQRPYQATSTAAVLEKFDKDVAEARQLLATTSDEEMFKTWTLKVAGKTAFEMPRIGVLRSMVMNHMIHHRAQFGVYLRLLDVPVPGAYGPSADDKPGFGA